jgi:alkylation response protein AidB-like acyl-CoA dehydrogenase
VAVIAPVQLDGDDALALLPLRDATLQQARQLDRPYFSHVTFDDAPVDGVRLLAQGERARSMHDHCDTLLTGLGLIELSGAMQRVLRMTADYISTRVQFGQPVAKFQSARHHAADMFMQVDATRWAAYHALDQYERLGDASGIWLSKLWAERAAAMVYELAHLLHGGVGVGIEYPLHLFTQGLAALAVRDGAAGEMTNRALATLGLAAGTRA